MKLLLTSAGLSTGAIKEKFLELIGKDPQAILIAFVPTASDPEPDKGYINKDLKILKGMGLQIKMVDLKEKSEFPLKSADAVFVEGGNTFHLLYWVRKSGFDKVLKEFLNQGKVYVGASAGSIIVGPSIETSGGEGRDKNIVKLKNLDGLNFVDFVIYPHYDQKLKNFVEKESESLSYELVPLRNDQAVVVENSSREII